MDIVRALVCLLLWLLGILNLNGTTLKKRRQSLDFIHCSHSSDAVHQEPNASFKNNYSGAFCAGGGTKTTERGRLDKQRTEQGPYDVSGSSSRPASSRQRRSPLRPQRCGTDAGGLRHRQEKEDASSQWTITSITTHFTDLFRLKQTLFLLHH